MAKRTYLSAALAACVGLGGAGMLAGCLPQQDPAQQAQSANRASMSALNQMVDEMSQDLAGFQDAAAKGDYATARMKLDAAKRVVDSIRGLKVPDGLKGAHDAYVAGLDELSAALAGFESAVEQRGAGESADAFSKRVAELQKAYDEGIAKIKAGDEALAKS